jgi:hypothetical protein
MSKTAAITCFFNFDRSSNNLDNFIEFKESIEKQNIPLFVIEITAEGIVPVLRRFCNRDRYLAAKTIVPILIKGNALNVLSSRVPKEYQNIAWLNCDTIIKNENWAEEAEKLLDNCRLVKVGKDSCYESPMVARRDFFEAVGLFDHDFCGNSNLVTFLSATNANLLQECEDLLNLYQSNNPEIFYKILSYRQDCYNYFNEEVSYLDSTIDTPPNPKPYSVEQSIKLLEHISVSDNIHYSGIHNLIAVKNIFELNYSTELINLINKV